MAFYDILRRRPQDIKRHKVSQYGYQKNRIDQTNWAKDNKIIHQKENLEENPKN